MTEQEYIKEVEAIFNRFPSFQSIGKSAYKPGIEGMKELCNYLGEPHKQFKSVHVTGTNGKGSVSSMVASALMNNRRVGLYTSPHLVDFRERIKVNGEMVSKEFVYNFLIKYRDTFESLNSSFFEITTALAFAYFAECKVDYAIIECGLGGRLDSTNIIIPKLSIITNIGLDHCDYLGDSYTEVAKEKGGIIKRKVPVVIGEKGNIEQGDFVADIFEEIALEMGAPIYFAQDYNILNGIELEKMDLNGACQEKNLLTVSTALRVLLGEELLKSESSVCDNIMNSAKRVGLRGRWEVLSKEPLVICDTGHNAHGFRLIGEQIRARLAGKGRLFMVFGVVADKDLESIVEFLPNKIEERDNDSAYYYFVNAKGSRAYPAEKLGEKLKQMGFHGEIISGKESVIEGVKKALHNANSNDFLFIGGSTFVVAEALEYFYTAEC